MPTSEVTVRSSEVTVRCEGVVRVYRSATGEAHALRGVDVTFRAGTVTAVAGPSGSGKSSLLRMVALRDLPSAGRLEVLGHDVGAVRGRALRRLRRRHVAFVEQRTARGLFTHLTAADHVRQVVALRGLRDVDEGAVLAAVRLDARAEHRPRALSGGEQQRLAVACALLGAPTLVVADEPTAELGHADADVVLAALHAAAEAGSTVVLSTHDPRALAVAARVLRLRHGVLGSEERRGARRAAIDSTGRVQLPPDALRLFPEGRAVLDVQDGAVVLRPPEEA